MKILGLALLGVLSAGVGAGGVYVADKIYWDNQLKVEMAERDKVIARLDKDITDLRSGLGTLKETNQTMRTIIDKTLNDSTEVLASNQSSVDKLRSVIVRLRALQTTLRSLP